MGLHWKKYSFLAGILATSIVTIIIYSWFIDTTYFQSVLQWAQINIILFCLALFSIKVIGLLWPPLPGIIFTIAAIPIIGWELALLINMAGEWLGASTSFWLSRLYGPKVILKLFGQSGLHQVRRFKFRPHKEFEAVLLMRVFTGAISELVSYGAGLTSIRFRNYLAATMLSSVAVGLPLFYLLSLVLGGGKDIIFGIIPLAIGITLLYLLRSRYFIWEN